jgi:hypothetical protein
MSWERTFYRGLLASSLTTVYTVPAGKRSEILSMDFCNTGTTALVVYLYVVPSGDTAGNGNALLYNFSIPAGDSSTGNIFPWRGFNVLNDEGDTIQAYKTGAIGAVHICGAEREYRPDTIVQ